MIEAKGGTGNHCKVYFEDYSEYQGELVECPNCHNQGYTKQIVNNALMECRECSSRFYIKYDYDNKTISYESI